MIFLSLKRRAFELGPERRGLWDMLIACLLFSSMNACIYGIRIIDIELPATVISFMRGLCNLMIVVLPALWHKNLRLLVGDGRPSLWLRGVFGTVALMFSFSAITRIGPGESAFLNASSGVFVALLGPWVLGQKNNVWVWLAISGSFAGILLLFKADGHVADITGRGMALMAGFLSSLAYLMVARAGRSNAPQTVIFYFCLVSLILHLAYFLAFGFSLPQQSAVWGLLLLTGLLGSGAQFYLTKAYQTAPAALVSAVGYMAPVLSLAWGVLVFGLVPGPYALLGSLLILLFGVLLPFLRR